MAEVLRGDSDASTEPPRDRGGEIQLARDYAPMHQASTEPPRDRGGEFVLVPFARDAHLASTEPPRDRGGEKSDQACAGRRKVSFNGAAARSRR